MGCCGKPPADAAEKEPKSLKKRTCTDVLCLGIFLGFLGVLGAICILGFSTGDYNQYLYEQDYLGNRCGVGTMAGKPKAFYPRIPRDMLDQNEIVQAGDFWKLKLYALCVSSCPKTFNIDNPENALVTDYGYDKNSATTQALGSGTQATWLSATPTLDVVNRCIPRAQTSQQEESMCAYPKCANLGYGIVCGSIADSKWDKGEWAICPAGTSAANCQSQKDTCKVKATETLTTSYEIHADDEASAAMMASIAKTVGGVFEIVSAVANAWVMIVVGGIAAPVALAFTYMLLLFLFAKIIIYGVLIMLIIIELVATFICFAKSGISFNGVGATDLISRATGATNVSVPGAAEEALAVVNEDQKWMYAVAFLILGIVTVLTIIMVITSRKKIRICAAIVKEATTVFTSMPLLMLFPSIGVVCQCVVVAWFLGTMILIYSTKPESIDMALGMVANTSSPEFEALGVSAALENVDPIGPIRGFMENENAITYLTIIVLYGFFVLIQFVQGISWCAMSASVYGWFFFKDNKKEKQTFPITRNLARTLFYHTGSVAFSAFVIAFCDMLRAACAYVEKQMGPTNNMMVKLAFKVVNCVLACLKKTVKFISYYGLVWVACQGTSFCGGCFKTFFFFLQNPGQVAINALVTKLLKVLSYSFPLACAVVFYYILDGVQQTKHANYPAAIIFVCAALMTSSCMTVFECNVTTIFVCCFQDKAEFNGRYMSSRLAKAFGIKQKGKGGDEKGGDAKADDDKKAEEPVQKV